MRFVNMKLEQMLSIVLETTKELEALVDRVSELEKSVDARFDMLTNVAKGQSEVCKHLANKISDLYDYVEDAFEGDEGHEYDII